MAGRYSFAFAVEDETNLTLRRQTSSEPVLYSAVNLPLDEISNFELSPNLVPPHSSLTLPMPLSETFSTTRLPTRPAVPSSSPT